VYSGAALCVHIVIVVVVVAVFVFVVFVVVVIVVSVVSGGFEIGMSESSQCGCRLDECSAFASVAAQNVFDGQTQGSLRGRPVLDLFLDEDRCLRNINQLSFRKNEDFSP
jgi:hypothetical protein